MQKFFSAFSMVDILTQAFFILLILFVTYLFSKFLKKVFKKMQERDIKPLNIDLKHYKFIEHLIIGAIYFLGISFSISVIPQLKGVALSLLASSGILVAVLGFASQQAVSNLVSGLFLEIFTPFRVGDRITVKNITGYVQDITLRHTVIRTLTNKHVVLPNSVMNSEVIENASRPTSLVKNSIDVYLSYDVDIERAVKTMNEIISSHPNIVDIRSKKEIEENKPLVDVKVIKLSPTAVNLRGWIWAQSASDAFSIACDIYKEIKPRFDKESIKFAQASSTVLSD